MVPPPPAVWTDRPAIRWCHDEERENKSCYWTPEILQLCSPLCGSNEESETSNGSDKDVSSLSSNRKTDHREENNSDSQDEEFLNQDSPTVVSVSYETLLLLSAEVVRQIRDEEILDRSSSNAGCDGRDITLARDRVGDRVTFAVAIPEGPMLPLAILVVHALNFGLLGRVPSSSSSSSSSSLHAVLVPMDPDEGKDRNLHILSDARPSFVLAVPGNASTKLQELIDQHNTLSSCDEADARTTRLLNFVDLVKVSRQRLESLSPLLENVGFGSLIGSSTLPAEHLQQMVSELATRLGLVSSATLCDEQPNTNNSGFDQQVESLLSNKVSHIVYTSGTTGRPKGCVSSTRSLRKYIAAKNTAHDIAESSAVLLASSLSFDPCLSDIVATFQARATLAIAPREVWVSGLVSVLKHLAVTHVLCTPTLWSLTLLHRPSDPGTAIKDDFPRLQRVALGGEPIAKSIVQAWARCSGDEKQNGGGAPPSTPSCRLLATYGVTEACVYQTCGEVFRNSLSLSLGPGQCVGHVLEGTRVKICKEEIQGNRLVEVEETGMQGEIVLFGDQVDACTGYLNRPELQGKFVAEILDGKTEDGENDASEHRIYHYRTGDRGYVDPDDGSLTVLGRIVGEEGMIKINGVRVELGEIEAALTSDDGRDAKGEECSIVTDCLAKVVKDGDGQSAIHAYCVFSENVWNEIGASQQDTQSTNEGIIVNGGPLWSLLRVKCSNRLRKACIPSAIVGIRRLPLSRTGKRDRSGLPSLEFCSILNISNQISTPLQDYGVSGRVVFDTLVRYLNLLPCQQQMLTKSVSFAVLGGDSLSAAVVCRTLYAHFHQLENSRKLGGEYGQLPEPFDNATLLRAQTLGEYVDLLDESVAANGLHPTKSESLPAQSPSSTAPSNVSQPGNAEEVLLYDALVQATTLNQSSIAVALLNLGADPNHGHDGRNRIANTGSRNARRAVFTAAPLHLACFRGDVDLVGLLLAKNASYKSPNTNGFFPIHLAAAGGLDTEPSAGEEARRLECVRLLLAAGCPLLMKDANKQSVLHAAARAGHCAILEHVIAEHQSSYTGKVPLKQFLEFQDRWFRSAVHWATLNKRVRALKLLLEKGCDPEPYKPRSNNKYTSMTAETPLEICRRLHAGTEKGNKMEALLREAIDSRNATVSP